jgi:chromatin remodeling complex protein RSC6
MEQTTVIEQIQMQQTNNVAEPQPQTCRVACIAGGAEPQPQNCRVGAEPQPTIESQFNSLLQDLSCFKLQLHDIQGKVKLLEKTITKELKSKGKQEKKQTTLNLQLPSGFDKPAPISEDMCLFLGKPIGSTMSLTELTQFMTNYIRDNKLQDMKERKIIKPNEALIKLLKLKSPDEQVTYFNLQKYLSIHFI